MSKSDNINLMTVWLIMNSERYIKKSIMDGSLAVYDEEECAGLQVGIISRANSEDCYVEEALLCNKGKLNRMIHEHNEMYEMLNKFLLAVEDDSSEDFLYEFHNIKSLLAKARGEL